MKADNSRQQDRDLKSKTIKSDAGLLEWIRRCPRRMMVGFHMPDYDQIPDYQAMKRELHVDDILAHIDPREFVRDVKRAHLQAFWFYSKCHYGNAYYPSKVGHVHSALKGRDLFGELVEACLSEGIVPLCVYEFHDLRMPKDHPEWCHKIPEQSGFCQVDATDAAQGIRIGGPCLNGPYGEFVLEQTREVLKQYPVKGYYIDYMGFFGFEKWICPHCNEKFKKAIGVDFAGTDRLSHDQYVRYVQWRLNEDDVYGQRMRKLIKDLRPDVAFVHNFHGFSGAEDMQWFDFASRNCDFLTADHFQLRHGMLRTSWALRLQAAGSQQKPAEALLDSMTCVHGDFLTPKALDDYRAELWTARSLNVATCTSIVMNLDGAYEKRIFDLNEVIMKEQAAYEPWLADMEPLAEVGLVRSSRTLAFRPAEKCRRGMERLQHQLEFEGWSLALIAAHRLWDVVDESQIQPDYLKRFKVLILPAVACLDRVQADIVADYVKAGGKVIATGDTSLFDAEGHIQPDFQLAEVFGAQFVSAQKSEYKHLLVEDNQVQAGNEPWISPIIRFTYGQLTVRADLGADVIGTIGRCSLHCPMVNTVFPTSHPGLVRHGYGQGQCWYFTGKPGLQFRCHGQNNVKRLMKSVLQQAAGDQAPVRLEAPDSVEMFAHRQKGQDHLVVNLVHTIWGMSRSFGNPWVADAGFFRFDDIETVPRLHELTLYFRQSVERPIRRIYLAPTRADLPMESAGNEVQARLTDVGVHTMVVADFAPKSI